jgi:hypothetical protein
MGRGASVRLSRFVGITAPFIVTIITISVRLHTTF